MRATRLFIMVVLLGMLSLSGCGKVDMSDIEHVQRAKQFQDQGDIRASIIELKNALKKNPNNPEARWLLGQAYITTGNAEGAVKELHKAKELGIPLEAIVMDLGKALLRNNDYGKVIEQVEPQERQSPPDKAKVHVIRGYAFIGLKEFEKAEAEFDKARKLDESSSDAQIGRAQLYAIQGEIDKASAMVDEVISRDNENYRAWVLKGDIARWQLKPEVAITAYKEALRIEPWLVEPRLNLAYVYIHQNQLDRAKEEVKEAEKWAPGYVKTNYLKGVINYLDKKYELASNNLNEVLKNIPGHLPSHLLNGEIQFILKRYEQAEASLSKYLAVRPNSVFATKLLAATWIQRGEPGKAIEILGAFLEKDVKDAQVWALAGDAMIQMGDFDLASTYLGKAVELSSENAKVRAKLGVSYMAAGKTEQGIEELERAISLDPKLGGANMVLVLTYIEQGALEKADQLIDELKDNFPDAAFVYYLKGLVALKGREKVIAQENFRKALELKPTYLAAASSLAGLYIENGEKEQAKKIFTRILSIDNKNISAMLFLANFASKYEDEKAEEDWLKQAVSVDDSSILPRMRLAGLYFEKGRPDKALPLLREASEIEPDNYRVLDMLGRVQMALGEFHNALVVYEKIARIKPKAAMAHYRLAKVRAILSQPDEAISALRKALALRPDFLDARLALLGLLLGQGQFADALKLAQEVKKTHPDRAMGWILEGDVYMMKKDYLLAAKAYEEALTRKGNDRVIGNVHTSYMLAGKVELANKKLDEWLAKNPADWNAFVYKGQYLLGQGDVEQARDLFAYVIENSPENVVALNNLAWIYHETGAPGALELAAKAYSVNGQLPQVADTYGWLLAENGDLERAAKIMQKAVALAPSDPDIRYRWSVVLFKSGERELAKQQLQMLIESKQQFENLSNARALLSSL